MTVGVALIINEEFRSNERCAICNQPLGDKVFIIKCRPKANTVSVECEHVECANKAESEFEILKVQERRREFRIDL